MRASIFALGAGVLFALGTASALAPSPDPSSDIARIVREGRDRSQALRILTELSRDIGGRPTGSKNLVRALDWAEREFKKAGVDTVYREEWTTIPETWHRGPRQSVRMISPRVMDMPFSTPVSTHGTKGPVAGPVVMAPATMEEYQQKKDTYKGAYMLMSNPANMSGVPWRTRNEVDKVLDEAGIAGRIYGTPGEFVWTGGGWRVWTPENRPKTPMIVIRRKDWLVLAANVEKRRSPRIEADIQNEIIPEPIKQYNLIAEIKGSEKPDEVVIFCGHIDSWDGPGSTGTSDNGIGVMATIEAARILSKAKIRPKRTIRFILWTGEEQGLLGATAYTEKHKDSLEKISALFNEDSGQNAHGAIAVLAPMKPIIEAAVAPLNQAFPDLPVEVRVVDRIRGGGSDHAPFVQKGVPAFFIGKRPGKPYNRIWHTQYDNLNEIEPKWLPQMATHFALLAYGVGNAPTMVPREGMTPAAGR